jgi:Family of unknown function (DUF6448)
MRFRTIVTLLTWPMLAFGLTLITPTRVLAHCDGLDGPVVKAAQKALETRNPALVLIWVQAEDEAEIRTAFDQTLAVRALSPEAKGLADRFFFETLVRVHRAGEGAPYTGLKPAGRDLGPAIPAADKALEKGSVETVVKLLTETMQKRLLEHFTKAASATAFKAGAVATGREYVKAYVEFIHYVERLYEASTTGAHGHSMKRSRLHTVVEKSGAGCCQREVSRLRYPRGASNAAPGASGCT